MPLLFTYALMLFCFASISAARVVLSLYALDVGASASAVGILFAAFYLFPLVFSWHVGRHADRVGSRWLLFAGAVFGTVGMAVPYFSRGLPAIYLAGLMIGVAFTSYNVLLQNLIGLLSKPHERARSFSNAGMVGASTNFLGPLLAGFAVDFSGHAGACLYVSALSLVAAILLLVWGAVLPGGSRQAPPAGSIRELLANPGVWGLLVTSSLVQAGQDLFQFYIPVYGYEIGLSASAIGAVLATGAVAVFVVRFAMPRLVARLGEERLLAYSFYLAAAGFAMVPFFRQPVLLAVAAFVFGLGMGCGQPVTTMLLFTRSAEGRSGETLGLRQAVNNVMRVSAPVVFGFIATGFGLFPVFWMSALMMAAGAWIVPREGKNPR